MKIDFFCNGSLDSEHYGFRQRGIVNGKTLRVPKAHLGGVDIQKNDGVTLEITGEIKATASYITVASAKLISHVPGAYKPAARVVSAEEAFALPPAPVVTSQGEPPFEV